MVEKKLFAGPRLKRIRRELGLTQSRMAEELSISASYLNLIERNQRPLTAQFLLKLAETYDLDLRSFTADREDHTFAQLSEALNDNLFADLEIPRLEAKDLADTCPNAAEAFLRLYNAYSEFRRDEETTTNNNERGPTKPFENPVERVSKYIRDNRNFFPNLDETAEDLFNTLKCSSEDLYSALRQRLKENLDITTRLMPVDVMSESLRRYDSHRKQLLISELLSQPSRTFQLAYQLALTEFSPTLSEAVQNTGFQDDKTQRLARINFAKYFAAALLMPYERFFIAAEELGYDIDLLGRRFGASFEQVSHRLTTLQKPAMKGIPFFMVRLDNAGNISKRFSAGKFHFSHSGGTCPLWNVHRTFQSPGKVITQIIELPDETQYFSIARTIQRDFVASHQNRQTSDSSMAIALGCDLKHAHKLAYTTAHDLEAPSATPIGVNCTLCERIDCAQRSSIPRRRTLIADERSRGLTSFTFKGLEEVS